MPLLNDVLNREKEIEKKKLDNIVAETSAVMRGMFKGKKKSIWDLVENTFVLGELTSEAFRARCCEPKTYIEVENAMSVYGYVSGMLGECGGALQHELIAKHGPEAEGISQKLVEIAIEGKHTKKEIMKIVFEMIDNIGKEKNEH